MYDEFFVWDGGGATIIFLAFSLQPNKFAKQNKTSNGSLFAPPHKYVVLYIHKEII